MTSEEARAVAEVAITASKALEVAGNAGSFLARIVGGIPENLLGLAGGDWLYHKRKRNLAQLEAETATILDGIARERITEPSPSVLMPLLNAAKDESREELRRLWANLLAQVMVEGGRKIRREYFILLNELDPIDAAVLDIAWRLPHQQTSVGEAIDENRTFLNRELDRIGLSTTDFLISRDKLGRLGLAALEGQPRLLPLGRGFLEMCRPPQ